MHRIHNIFRFTALLLAFFGLLTFATPTISHTYAADDKKNQNDKNQAAKNQADKNEADKKKKASQGDHCSASNNCDLVDLYVNPFIRVLSVVVGLAVAASLIAGGIQYTTSAGDPQRASAAKSRITNTLLAFLAFLFLYAFLNFLVPGGIFNR